MWGPMTAWGGGRGAAGPTAAAAAGGGAAGQDEQQQQQQLLEQARKEALGRVEEKLRREEVKDAERHRGRSRYYGGYESSNGGGSSDVTRPYYVQPWLDRAFGAPLEYRAIRPLPQAIVRAYAQLQSMSFQGLWPEIHRAWVTVDNVLFLWDYHTEESHIQIDELDQLIVAVGLVRPNPDVFNERVKYLIVVCTPTAVELFALWFADPQAAEAGGGGGGSVQVRRTSFRVSTDGVIVRKVVGSASGRIFLAGQDGNMYEVYYEHEGASLAQALGLANKCRKINRTQSAASYAGTLVQPLVQRLRLGGLFGSDSSELVDLVVDDSRRLLYSLSASSVIQLYDLGERGDAARLLAQREDVFRKAELLCRARGMHVEERHLQKGHSFRIVSIHVVPPTESDLRHLVAVSNAGFRFYFTTSLGPSVRATASQRPDRLELIDVRYPPKPGVWDALLTGTGNGNNNGNGSGGRQREAEAREKYEPGFVPNNSPLTYYQAHYADGVLVLADGTEDQMVDSVVAFCEEGSADRGGEVVCRVTAPYTGGGASLGLGKVRAMAEEPYVVFPIPDIVPDGSSSSNLDRAIDQLRYLVATSASPGSDERRSAPTTTLTANGTGTLGGNGNGGAKGSTVVASRSRGSYAGEWAAMYEAAGGAAAPQHLATRFGAALKEAAQPLTSSRIFVLLTSTGLHVVGKLRPVDVVLRLLQDHGPGSGNSASTHLGLCDGVYGPEELCALLYHVAARAPPDVGYPVGRQLLATPLPAAQTAAVVGRAAQFIQGWYARPVSTAAVTGTTTTALPSSFTASALSTQFEGLVLAFSRLIRAVWFKPVTVASGPCEGAPLVLLLRTPEIEALTAPLRRLKGVVASLCPHATRSPPPPPAAAFMKPPATATGMALLPPPTTAGATAAADAAQWHEHAQMHALFRLMDRSLQALELLAHLASYWEECHRAPLPLERLRDVAFVDLVSSPSAQEAVKATVALLLQQPARLADADGMAERLTRGLSERASSFFSPGDQLTHAGRRFLAQAASFPLDSADRAAALAQAAVALVRAAGFWRGPTDVDALDGAGPLRGGGLAHALLSLAPTQPEVLDAVVDMALTAAANFGARPYLYHGSGGGASAQLQLQRRGKAGKAAAAVGGVGEGNGGRVVLGGVERAELKQRCFLAVRDAVRWLLDPRARGNGGGTGLPQELLERAAWRVIQRCVKGSEDEELHGLLYAALLQEQGQTPQEMLLSVQSPFIERFLDAQPARLELLKRYYQHNDRQAEAMELLESAALSPQDQSLRLPERVSLLREAIQCAALASSTTQGGGGGIGAVSAAKLQALQDQLDVAQLQLKALTRLEEVVARVPGALEGEEPRRQLQALDRGFLPSTQLFQVCSKYTLWEECLEVIAMCNTDASAQRDMGPRVEYMWRCLIFNELPARAHAPELQAWLERRGRDCLSRWWSSGRGDRAMRGQHVGLQDGWLDDPQDTALRALFERITGLARAMHVDTARPSPSSSFTSPTARPAFPLRFLVSLLLELEAEVDAAQGQGGGEAGTSFPHRTWRMLRSVGCGFMELFASHIDAYKEAHIQARSPRLKLHILDALRDLTAHWYSALRETTPHGAWDASAALIDTRQQSAVVRELSKLANASNAGNVELNRVLDELARLQEKFQMFPDYLD